MVDPGFISSFLKEAKKIAAFEHPNIVEVHNAGEEAGRIFIDMRYLPGGSLRQRIKERGPLPWTDVLRIRTGGGCWAAGGTSGRGGFTRTLSRRTSCLPQMGML